MSRELLLIPKEKYDMILKNQTKDDDGDKPTNTEVESKETCEVNLKEDPVLKKKKKYQRGSGFIVKRKTTGPPPGFSMHKTIHKEKKKKKNSVQWFKL